MGVALENARLFDETKRLLTETDQRAAELAIINGVQQGLAAELDMQAMYDLVGDKIQEIFDAQVVDIGILRPRAGSSASRTRSSAASGSRTSRSLIGVPAGHGDRPAAPDQRGPRDRGAELGQSGAPSRASRRVGALRAAPVGAEAIGVVSLQNLDREHAFSQSDMDLLTTLARA